MRKGGRKTRGRITQGRKRDELVHELATGEKSLTQLAKEFGYASHVGVIRFRKLRWAEIQDVRWRLDRQLDDLWIAKKEKRLAAYQQDVENIDQVCRMEYDEDGNAYWTVDDPTTHLKVKHKALQNSAEELGSLPARTNINVQQQQLNVHIEGVDMDQLR